MPRPDGFAQPRPSSEAAPPALSVYAALGVFLAGALIARTVEFATYTRVPSGVQGGFVAAIAVVLVGIGALLYGFDKRRVFIAESLAEAQDWQAVVERMSPADRADLLKRAGERLLNIEGDLSRTGAYTEAAWVAQLRRDLLLGPSRDPRRSA
jgi:hypothetical protein